MRFPMICFTREYRCHLLKKMNTNSAEKRRKTETETVGQIKGYCTTAVSNKYLDAFYILIKCIIEMYITFFGTPVFTKYDAASNGLFPIFS